MNIRAILSRTPPSKLGKPTPMATMILRHVALSMTCIFVMVSDEYFFSALKQYSTPIDRSPTAAVV
jgi:hypothetical protein